MINIHWFRRDLRLEDNAALYHALKQGTPVLCVFIFDSTILEKLNAKNDARVNFIHQEVSRLKAELEVLGSTLLIEHGIPLQVWQKITRNYTVKSVFTNHDYEPYAIQRDQEISGFLNSQNIEFKTYKDQVIFEKSEVTKDDGSPYTVFTPFSKKWKSLINDFYLKPYPTQSYFQNFFKTKPLPELSLSEIGFEPTNQQFPEKEIKQGIIKNYEFNRDIPSINGTSKLSLHLRFGTISVRQKAAAAMAVSEKMVE
jgi:deoxyribodipyrimidine photo-lyase